uniref:Testis expressed 264, ER-phagy receptor n=1 Tax=Esox lucius TaxID=8010 RepID=A0AAY5KPR3_ESOLU
MSECFILCLIVLFSLFVTVVGYLLYSGLLSEIIIRTGSPPIKNITVAYKFKQGPYKKSGQLFTESCSIGPELSSIGVFYDDPKKVPGENCRCAVGSILSEGDARPSEELLHLYEKFGFRVFSFPEVTHVVSASFPHRTPLSILFGVQKVYPQLDTYIKERKLCAHPFLEIYKDNRIHYMSPLGRQGDFYVPEVRQDPDRRRLGEDDSEEDRETDISEVSGTRKPSRTITPCLCDRAIRPHHICLSTSLPSQCYLLPWKLYGVESSSEFCAVAFYYMRYRSEVWTQPFKYSCTLLFKSLGSLRNVLVFKRKENEKQLSIKITSN